MRTTFHFKREQFLEMALGESIKMTYSEDKTKERNAARQQTYRFNRYCREHNINKKLSIHEYEHGITITRVE